jgi:teichuronic acid biosynthesis glycosyltransferase TuaH
VATRTKVVVCSEVQWHYVRTRKQQLLRRFPADWPILFLQSYVRGRPNAWRPQRDGNVTFVTVPVFKSVPDGLLRRCLDVGFVRGVINLILAVWVWTVRATTGFGSRNTALFVSNIFYGRILATMTRRVAIYDCNDNHLAFPGTPIWAAGYLRRVVRGVDAVVVSSNFLREEIDPLGPRRVVEIGNGVDFDLFDAAFRAPRRVEAMARLPRPCVGYAGALAEWIDLELMVATARAIPHGTMVLVGPAVGPAVRPAELAAATPNLVWLGAKAHEDLPHYLAAMDVCLIPFRSNALTRGVNPNKLWEYLAMGKPVVATDFSPFVREYAAVVRVGPTPEAFVREVQAALAATESAADVERRRDIARRHGWDESAARMVALIRELAAAG